MNKSTHFSGHPIIKQLLNLIPRRIVTRTVKCFDRYLKEMLQKYPPGTKIRTNKYSEIDGQLLQGQMYLEIPNSNQSFIDIQRYINYAKDNYDIIIRFRPE